MSPGVLYPIGAARAVEAAVGGAPGLWIEDVPVGFCAGTGADGRGQNEAKLADILAWDRDGVRYRLMADTSLGFDETVKIAASLHPPTAVGWLQKALPPGDAEPTHPGR
jgi:hypothetical protein